MRVILLKEVKNLGRKGEIVKVKNGYGRNYLLPLGLAKIATEKEIKEQREIFASQKEKEEKLKKRAEEIAKEIEGKELVFTFKKTPKGKLFGSLGEREIKEKIEESFPELRKMGISFKDNFPLKKFGEFFIEFLLKNEVKGKLKVVIKEE